MIKNSKLLLLVSFFTLFIVFATSKVFAQGTLPAIGSIDSPTNNSSINGQSVVRGWFLDGSGVAKVEVLVDGKTIGTAKYGILRNDVAKVYPKYKNHYSGYLYTLDTTRFTNGKHTLTVKGTGKNGSATVLKNFTVNVNNLPAIGFIDAPANNSSINAQPVVRGWFLDGSGVAKIEVLVDGRSMGIAKYSFVRNDVAKAYTQYKNANSGYEFTLDTTKFTNGKHVLTVKETGKNGSTTVLKYLTVNVNNPEIGQFVQDIRHAIGNKAPATAVYYDSSNNIYVSAYNARVLTYTFESKYAKINSGVLRQMPPEATEVAAAALSKITGVSYPSLEDALTEYIYGYGPVLYADKVKISYSSTLHSLVAEW